VTCGYAKLFRCKLQVDFDRFISERGGSLRERQVSAYPRLGYND
jgi:hypothetical protein